MPRIKIYFVAVVAILVLAATVFSVLIPLMIKPEVIQRGLVEKIETVTGGVLTFDQFRLSYFPKPTAMIHRAKLSFARHEKDLFNAERVTAQLKILPIFFGKIEVGGVRVLDGEATFATPSQVPVRQIKIQRLQIKISALEAKERIRIKFEGAPYGTEKTLEGKAELIFDQGETPEGVPTFLNAEVELRKFPLEKLEGQLDPKFPVHIQAGTLSGRWQIEKAKESKWVSVQTHMLLEKFVYQMHKDNNGLTSPAINGNLDIELGWNPNSGEVDLKRGFLDTPIGKMEANGHAFMDTGQLQDVRLRFLGVSLETIPQYHIGIQDAIPFNIGFSGPSDLEMSLSGTFDHLSLHGNWDLTPTLLTYGGYFSKPKGAPLNFYFDYLLKKGKTLSGDFSLKFEKAKAKGALANVDFETGKGQINLITNKFPLAGWETLVPPLRDYEMDGKIKILVNFSGDFKKTAEVQSTLNLTLEDAKFIHRENGTGIRNVRMALDYSPAALEVKHLQFEVQDSLPVEVEAAVYRLPEAPIAKGKITSARLSPFFFAASVKDFLSGSLSPGFVKKMEEIEGGIERLFPRKEFLENLKLDFEYRDKKLSVPHFEFDAYDGKVKTQAGFDFAARPVAYSGHAEVDRLSLARFSHGDPKQKLIEGNAFLKADLKGAGFDSKAWNETLTGQGEFSITNGEFYSFDLLGSLGKINELKGLGEFNSGATPFTDVRSAFEIKQGKLFTPKLTLLSRDLSATADGNMTFEGGLNYRAEAFLEGSLARKILGAVLGDLGPKEEKQLGPIPLLIAGPFQKPEVKADSALLPQFLEQLVKKKSHEIFRNFLSEETFFGKRAKS